MPPEYAPVPLYLISLAEAARLEPEQFGQAPPRICTPFIQILTAFIQILTAFIQILTAFIQILTAFIQILTAFITIFTAFILKEDN